MKNSKYDQEHRIVPNKRGGLEMLVGDLKKALQDVPDDTWMFLYPMDENSHECVMNAYLIEQLGCKELIISSNKLDFRKECPDYSENEGGICSHYNYGKCSHFEGFLCGDFIK